MFLSFCRRFGTILFASFCIAGLRGQDLHFAKPEEVGLSSERLERLSAVFSDYANRQEMAGSVILVARRGKVAFFEPFGKLDLESNSPMTREAIFRIASQTKAIISVGIMILQEEGKLLIADPVGRYLPEFMETTVAEPRKLPYYGYEVVNAKRPITIRDLLTHTAGIGYGDRLAGDRWEEAGIVKWYLADRDETISEVVSRMAKLPMDAQPGEAFVYGYGTDILGALIEKVSDQPLDEFISTRILEPLGMIDTHFFLPRKKANRLAVVYKRNDEGLQRAPETGLGGQGAYVNGPRKCFSGGGGLLSTASDYYRFLQMMLNGGILDGRRILSPKTVELMTTNHLRDVQYGFTPGVGFGLGFSVVEDLGDRGTPGSVAEYGWAGAYGTVYWVDPKEELAVVYLVQSGHPDAREKVRALVYQAIIE